jgi:hypothetical protein
MLLYLVCYFLSWLLIFFTSIEKIKSEQNGEFIAQIERDKTREW